MSSLVSMALRLSARRLLDGATFAGERVHDSAIAPIDHMVEAGNDEPFIVISTEDEEASSIQGRDVTGGHRKIDLVIEIAIAHAVAAQSEAGPEIVIPSTDAGFEVSLSLIGRQVMRALFEQKDSPWDLLFKRFCLGVEKITNRRGVGNKDGARFAARQIILTLDCLQEPYFGHEPAEGEPWGDLLAQIEGDAELAPLAPLIRQSVTGKPDISAWDRPRSDQGLTDEATARIGLAVPGIEGEEPPLLNDGDTNADTEIETDGGFSV
jgi:hypothetical protein